MGLDIQISADNIEDLHSEEYFEKEDYYDTIHKLSRTFCNFMCRQHVIESGEPELDQIGRITDIDITPIYDMENYPDEEGLDFHISTAKDENERKAILRQAEIEKENLKGNIDKVITTVTNLIDRLSKIEDLPKLLASTSFDSLNNKLYFSEFNKENKKSYVYNNFGQDLRNFKRFLEYAKSKGTTTVWFQYG